ncbi:uncharacterized protein LOC126584420, partial [Malus sylvestris]|uniref:uncharacterized protein LOC126584420 n=1 Tax=Malus sylvestris TaxID=3752 RepID=UPI0021AC91C8
CGYSVPCFNKHKENPCALPVFSDEKPPTAGPELLVERPLVVEEPREVLQRPQLEAIASSSETRSSLKDENLQKLISSIDCSPDAEKELEKLWAWTCFRYLPTRSYLPSRHLRLQQTSVQTHKNIMLPSWGLLPLVSCPSLAAEFCTRV